MKNRKLYESIQRLVNHKDNTKKNKFNFAQQYCNEQMRRKKLVPKDSTSKIDELMKNFKKIDTFINVDDLIGCVNEVYLEEEKQIKKQIIEKTQMQKNPIHKRHISQVQQVKVLNKAKSALKDYHQHLYRQQSQNMCEVLNSLERNSTYLCQTMKNKQKYSFFTKMENKQRNNKFEKMKESEGQPNQKWNLYANATNFIKTQPNQDNLNLQEKQHQHMNGYKKKKKMFDLAQIYLQMILEQEYRKKWNKDSKLVNSRRNIMRKNNTQVKPIQLQSIQAPKDLINNNIENVANKQNLKFEETQSTANTHFIRTRGPERKQNTRIIKHKDIVIKKVNNFLLQLEQDQYSLKNEIKLHLSHLDRLQKHIDDDQNMLNCVKIWKDQEKCEQIKLALNRQQK